MAKDKSKSVVLSLKTHLAKVTIDTWYTDLKKKADQHNLTENKHVKHDYTHTKYTNKSRVKNNTPAKHKPLSHHKQL